jgi:hypothetical protein
MEIPISENLKKYILLEDIQSHNPTFDPFVFLAKSYTKKSPDAESNGIISETVLIESFLVPISQKDKVIEKFQYNDTPFRGGETTYFDADGTYYPGEILEEGDLSVEIIVNDRSFPSLNIAYFEPTDRLIKYLNLHRVENNWIDPYKDEEIIKKVGQSRGYEPHDTYLTIRKSELKDYLAARKCGLLILRYAERHLKTSNTLIGFPEPYDSKETRNGHSAFFIDKTAFDKDKNMYYSRLWDSFWIDPASAPRRWDANCNGEFKDGVKFTLNDGENVTYKQDGNDRYFEVLSFSPTVIHGILSKPNHSIEFHCISTFSVHFPEGQSLECCVNKEGQIQSFFGQVAKLSSEKQQFLSGFSEPQKAKMSPEYIRTYIKGEFPFTWPWNKTISECLRIVNEPWIQKFEESLLYSPNEADIAVNMRLGPATNTDEELIDIMLELQKIVIPEYNINKIKTEFDCSSQLVDKGTYPTIRAVVYAQLLFKQYSIEKVEGRSRVLKIINELRNCKGHPKNVEEILSKYGYSGLPRKEVFYQIMAEFCAFLLDIKAITEKLFNIEYPYPSSKIEDPWWQLKVAQKYFSNPF